MPLSDTRIRNARAGAKPYKLTDGRGLHLLVVPKRPDQVRTTKLWRYRYRIAGKENVFALGEYPEVSLQEAREQLEAARKLVKQGTHPAHQRRIDRIQHQHEHANTFKAIAEEWLERKAKKKWTPATLRQRQNLLKADVYPRIGPMPMRMVTAAMVRDVLETIEKRAPAMAALAKQCIGAVARYAVATGRGDADPSAPLTEVLQQHEVKHKTPLKRTEIAAFVKKIDDVPSYPQSKIAAKLALLTLVRSTEIIGARWEEFDLDNAIWTIPKERMKKRRALTLPLPVQAVELLRQLQTLTGKRDHLFPNRAEPRLPASKGLLWKFVAEVMGYGGKFSPHGIRATGSSILHEDGFRSEVIEFQLAHLDRNATRRSYNQAEYLEERRKMMQHWADLIDTLVAGNSKVTPIRRTAAA